jgi:hypothetical protein
MSGIIAVYGLVMAVLIAGSLNPLDDYSLYKCLPSFAIPAFLFDAYMCTPTDATVE